MGAHLPAKDPVEAGDQFRLIGSTEHTQCLTVDMDYPNAAHEVFDFVRILIQILCKILHPTGAQIVEEDFDPAVILLPERYRRVFKKTSVMIPSLLIRHKIYSCSENSRCSHLPGHSSYSSIIQLRIFHSSIQNCQPQASKCGKISAWEHYFLKVAPSLAAGCASLT